MGKKKDKAPKQEQDGAKGDGASPLSAKPAWVDLLVAGGHRAARAEAKKALADPAATDADKAAAHEVLARTAVESGALGAGLTALAVLLTIVVLLALSAPC